MTVDLEKETGFQRTEKKRKSEEEERKPRVLELESRDDLAPPPRRAERTPGAGIPGRGPFSGSRLQRCGREGGGGGGGEEGVWTATPGWEDGSVKTFGIRVSTQSLIL